MNEFRDFVTSFGKLFHKLGHRKGQQMVETLSMCGRLTVCFKNTNQSIE